MVGLAHLSGAQAATADPSAGRASIFTNASGIFASLWVTTTGITAVSLMYMGATGTPVVICQLPVMAEFIDAPCGVGVALVPLLRASFIEVFSTTLPAGAPPLLCVQNERAATTCARTCRAQGLCVEC